MLKNVFNKIKSFRERKFSGLTVEYGMILFLGVLAAIIVILIIAAILAKGGFFGPVAKNFVEGIIGASGSGGW